MMKYGEIKDTLTAAGYELEYFQTSGELDLLMFNHPTIEGGINIDFIYSTNGIPQEVIDGKEFTYDDDWVRDIVVSSVEFERDMSISYMTDGVLDVCGASHENKIFLYGEDIDRLFHIVMKLIIDPEAMLNFQLTYNKKVLEFVTEIKRFVPALNKENLKLTIHRVTGNEDSLFTTLIYDFTLIHDNKVQFIFEPLSWITKIHMAIKSGGMDDDDILPLDTQFSTFEKILTEQCKLFKQEWEAIKLKHGQSSIWRRE